MAKKRLNKRLIGILLLVLMAVVVVAVIIVIQYKYRDPRPFLEQAYQLMEEAREADALVETQVASIEDPKERFERRLELKKESSGEIWKEVIGSLGNVMRYARGDQELRMEAYAVLADLYAELAMHTKANGVLIKMFEQDASNYDVKRKLVEFAHTTARNGMPSWWPEVYTQSQVLIDLNEEQELNQPYGYLARAHACVAMVVRMSEENPEERLAEAEELLQRALEFDENNVEAFARLGLLRQRLVDRVDDEEEKDRLRQEGEDYFYEAITRNPDNETAYTNLLEMHLFARMMEEYGRVDNSENPEEREQMLAWVDQFVQEKVKPVLAEAVAKFPDSGKVIIFQARLVLVEDATAQGIGKCIELYERALTRETENATWHLSLANAFVAHSELVDDAQGDLESALKWLWRGLYLPETNELRGPKGARSRQLRFATLRQVVEVSTKLASRSEGEDKEQYLAKASDAAKELQDTLGDDHPVARIAMGTVLLAQGERDEGITQLFLADKEYESEGRTDGPLKMKLFEALRGTEHQTLAMRYAGEGMSLVSGGSETLLDYMRTMLQLPGRQYPGYVLEMMKVFEGLTAEREIEVSADERLELSVIKAMAYVQGRQLAAAREVLDVIQSDTREVRLLRAQAADTPEARRAALEELVSEDASDISLVRVLVTHYQMLGAVDPNLVERGRAVISEALQAAPDDVYLREMWSVFGEPDPAQVSRERRREIRLSIKEDIADPAARAIALGKEYVAAAKSERAAGNEDAAQEYWRLAKESYAKAIEIDPKDVASMAALFDVAKTTKDWAEAAKLVTKISDVDHVVGLMSEGSLNVAQSKWAEAADRLEEYVAQRPVSAHGHYALAVAYAGLEEREKAIAELVTAVGQNSSHLLTNGLLMQLMHARNLDKGLDTLNIREIIEMISVAERVLSIDQLHLLARRVRVIYYPLWIAYQVEILNEKDSAKEQKAEFETRIRMVMEQVVETCNTLIRDYPNQVSHWIMFANILGDRSNQVKDPKRGGELLQMAVRVYEEGLKANPSSARLAMQFALFLGQMGKGDVGAENLLAMVEASQGERKDQAQIQLARFYRRQNKTAEAREQVKAVLARNAENSDALYVLAGLTAAEENFAEGAKLMAQAREIQDNVVMSSQHIQYLMRADDMDQVDTLFERMRQEYPESPHTWLTGARMAMRRMDYVATVGYAEKALAKDARNVRAYMLKANALYRNEKLVDAVACLTELRGIAGRKSNVGRELLATVYWQLLRYDDAIRELEDVVESDREAVNARERLVVMLQARSKWAQLEQLYAEMRQEEPEEFRWYYEAGQALLVRARKYKEIRQQRSAVSQYGKAVKLLAQAYGRAKNEDDQLASLEGLLSALRGSGGFNEVVRVVDKRLADHPDNIMLLGNKAFALYALKQKTAALTAFEQAVVAADASGKGAEYIAQWVGRTADLDATLAWAKSKLASRPDWPMMQIVLSRTYGLMQDAEHEAQVLEEMLAGELSEDEEGYAMLSLMLAYGRTDRVQKGIAIGRQMLEKTPRNIKLLNNLAYMMMAADIYTDETVRLAKTAYEMDEHDHNVMDTYGMTLIGVKDFVKADLILRQAIQEGKNKGEGVPAEFYLHRAQALVGLGQRAEARDVLRREMASIGAARAGSYEQQIGEEMNRLLQEMSAQEEAESHSP